MTQFLFANNAATTVGSTFSSLATILAVATGTGILFPAPAAGQQFTITLSPAASTTGTPFEICYVTAVSGDTFTVVRAQEGTTALNWAVGDFVQNRWTQGQAAALAQQVDVQKQAGNYGVDTGTLNAGAVTLSPAPVSLASLTGAPIRVLKINTTNTGAYTLNVNGFGAVPVVSATRSGGLISGDLPGNYVFTVVLSGGSFLLQSELGVNSPEGAAGGDLSGTYPNPVIAAGAVTTGKLAGNAVTNSILAQASADTFKGNPTGSTANLIDMTPTQAVALLGQGVTQALANPGYVFLPGGILIQWIDFSVAAPVASSVAVIWPIPFPNAVLFNPTVNVVNAASNQLGTTSVTATGCTVEKGSTDGQARTGTVWAVGF